VVEIKDVSEKCGDQIKAEFCDQGLLLAKFEIDKFWQGELTQNQEIYLTVADQEKRKLFEVGKNYLVFAEKKDGLLFASACESRTNELESQTAQADLKKLGKAQVFEAAKKEADIRMILSISLPLLAMFVFLVVVAKVL